MYLEGNTLFDNRYQLIKKLGQGASAQVWLANDTLTGNLRVAIKIFNSSEGIDVAEEQNFKNEFKKVYDIIHQNLLTPTNYSVGNGTPYLVMPYCENGSISSMVGRCDESDVIRILHDVAAGLDHLHKHGIVHQDIKPDNIMVDNDLDYLITDFGISAGNDDIDANYGGTRAYMAPERFNGISDKRGDVWSLGATAYEMLSGNPPFGDHGGIVQSQGEKIHKIDGVQLQPQMEKLIESMLDFDPNKRPTPKEIHSITDRYLRTGKWTESSANNLYPIIAVVVAVVVLVAGVFILDRYRTKTYYYRDYVECYGIPQPIGEKLKGSQHRAMRQCYRFEYREGKLIRVSFVNSKGNVIPIRDIEANNLRFPDQEFEYDGSGNLSDIIVKDQYGRKLYKIKYELSNNKSTAIAEFKYPIDDKNISKYYSGRTDGEEPSVMSSRNIIEMRMTYDDQGRLVKREYLRGEDLIISDANGISGQEISYDNNGRVILVRSINKLGFLAGDATGIAERRYVYNSDGFIESISYLGADGKPARDAVNRSVIKFEYADDQTGNSVREFYTDGMGNAIPRSSDGAYGYEIKNTNDGLVDSYIYLGLDGCPHVNKDGYDRRVFKVNDDGFDTEVRYYRGNILATDANNIAGYDVSYTPEGLPLDTVWVDAEENTIRKVVYNYGDNSSVRVEYDSSDKFVVSRKDMFNDLGQTISTVYFNEKGDTIENPSTGVARIRYNYDRNNHQIISTERFALGGKRVNDKLTGFSIEEYSARDSEGRISYVQFLGKDKRLIDHNGFAKLNFEYDDEVDMVSHIVGFNQFNKEVLTLNITYDSNKQPIISGKYNGGRDSFGPVRYLAVYDAGGLGASLVVKNETGEDVNVVLPNGSKGCHINQNYVDGKVVYTVIDADGKEVSASNVEPSVKSIYYLINTYICNNNTTVCSILGGLSAQQVIVEVEETQTATSTSTPTQQAPKAPWMQKVEREASNCPRQVEDGIVLRSVKYTANSVRLTIAMKYYDGPNDRRDEVIDNADYYCSMPYRQWGVPNDVECHVTIYDRNNKVIYQN